MPVVVCNEINAGIARGARRQHPDHGDFDAAGSDYARELVGLMVHAIEAGAANAPGQTFLPFDIYHAARTSRFEQNSWGSCQDILFRSGRRQ